MKTTSGSNAKSWVLAVRPKTLGAGLVPVLASTALAQAMTGQFRSWVLVCTLSASLFIQVATNLFNDAIDHEKGADTQKRLGPVRVSASGLIAPKLVFRTAVACIVIALLFSVPLIKEGGILILAFGLISLFLSLGYTGGPFPLAYLGLGDLFVFLFFGLFAVLGTYHLQSHQAPIPIEAFALATQIGLWATALIAINNFRDSAEDKLTQKNTLSVRFGPIFSRAEISGLLLLPFTIGIFFWPARHFLLAACLPILILPLALKIVIDLWKTEPSPHYNVFLAQAGGVHLVGGLLLIIGFICK